MMIDLRIKLRKVLEIIEDIQPIMSEFPIPIVSGKEKDLRKEEPKTEKDLTPETKD